MTKKECAIVMAYTGIAMLQGEDITDYFYKYVHDLFGRPVYTHELARKEIADKLKELSKPDFIELCRTATEE